MKKLRAQIQDQYKRKKKTVEENEKPSVENKTTQAKDEKKDDEQVSDKELKANEEIAKKLEKKDK